MPLPPPEEEGVAEGGAKKKKKKKKKGGADPAFLHPMTNPTGSYWVVYSRTIDSVGNHI